MVDGIILDIELTHAETVGEARGPHERREPGMQSRARLAGDRQQLLIAP